MCNCLHDQSGVTGLADLLHIQLLCVDSCQRIFWVFSLGCCLSDAILGWQCLNLHLDRTLQFSVHQYHLLSITSFPFLLSSQPLSILQFLAHFHYFEVVTTKLWEVYVPLTLQWPVLSFIHIWWEKLIEYWKCNNLHKSASFSHHAVKICCN